MLLDDIEDEVDVEFFGLFKFFLDIMLVLCNCDVKEGGVIKFVCCVVSGSVLIVEWYKDEKFVSKWFCFIFECDEDFFVLIILDVKRIDVGYIRFVARNEFG